MSSSSTTAVRRFPLCRRNRRSRVSVRSRCERAPHVRRAGSNRPRSCSRPRRRQGLYVRRQVRDQPVRRSRIQGVRRFLPRVGAGRTNASLGSHPLGATGLGMAFYLVNQLRGWAGPMQDPECLPGVAESKGKQAYVRSLLSLSLPRSQTLTERTGTGSQPRSRRVLRRHHPQAARLLQGRRSGWQEPCRVQPWRGGAFSSLAGAADPWLNPRLSFAVSQYHAGRRRPRQVGARVFRFRGGGSVRGAGCRELMNVFLGRRMASKRGQPACMRFEERKAPRS